MTAIKQTRLECSQTNYSTHYQTKEKAVKKRDSILRLLSHRHFRGIYDGVIYINDLGHKGILSLSWYCCTPIRGGVGLMSKEFKRHLIDVC